MVSQSAFMNGKMHLSRSSAVNWHWPKPYGLSHSSNSEKNVVFHSIGSMSKNITPPPPSPYTPKFNVLLTISYMWFFSCPVGVYNVHFWWTLSTFLYGMNEMEKKWTQNYYLSTSDKRIQKYKYNIWIFCLPLWLGLACAASEA